MIDLLDDFAKAAMNACVQKLLIKEENDIATLPVSLTNLCIFCYDIAEGMLKERKERHRKKCMKTKIAK